MLFDFNSARDLDLSLYFEIDVELMNGTRDEITAYNFCEEHLDNDGIVIPQYDVSGNDTNVWTYNRTLHFLKLNSELFPNAEESWTLCLSNTDFGAVLERVLEEDDAKLFLSKFKEVYGEDAITPRLGIVLDPS